MVELFANSGDPDQTPHVAASDMGLHCLPVTRLGITSLQWVNITEALSSLGTLWICERPRPLVDSDDSEQTARMRIRAV